MKLLKKFSASFFIMAVLVGIVSIGAPVSAAPTVDFGNVDNLTISEATTLSVSATGLVPNAQVTFLQCTGESTGEICIIAGCPQPQSGCTAQLLNTDASGAIIAPVEVSYNAAEYYGFPFDTCVNLTDPLRNCDLRMIYLDGNSEIAQTKLNFGNTVVAPSTKDDCTNGKWNTFTALGFKNQGACISYVNRG